MKISAAALIGLASLAASPIVNSFQPSYLPKVSSGRASGDFSLQVAASPEQVDDSKTTDAAKAASTFPPRTKPFNKVMAANRAEIAVRIMRASTELNMQTVAIYGYEDRYSQHRWGADQSFVLEKEESATPISAYLDIDQIISIAKTNGVDAIHPGEYLATEK